MKLRSLHKVPGVPDRFCRVLHSSFPKSWSFLEQYSVVCSQKQKVLQEFQLNKSLPPYTPPLCDITKSSLRPSPSTAGWQLWVEHTLFCPSLPPSLRLLLTKPIRILSAHLPLPLVLFFKKLHPQTRFTGYTSAFNCFKPLLLMVSLGKESAFHPGYFLTHSKFSAHFCSCSLNFMLNFLVFVCDFSKG